MLGLAERAGVDEGDDEDEVAFFHAHYLSDDHDQVVDLFDSDVPPTSSLLQLNASGVLKISLATASGDRTRELLPPSPVNQLIPGTCSKHWKAPA